MLRGYVYFFFFLCFVVMFVFCYFLVLFSVFYIILGWFQCSFGIYLCFIFEGLFYFYWLIENFYCFVNICFKRLLRDLLVVLQLFCYVLVLGLSWGVFDEYFLGIWDDLFIVVLIRCLIQFCRVLNLIFSVVLFWKVFFFLKLIVLERYVVDNQYL